MLIFIFFLTDKVKFKMNRSFLFLFSFYNIFMGPWIFNLSIRIFLPP